MNNPMQNLATVITEKFISADPVSAAKALESLATHEIILLVGTLKAHTLVSCFNPMNPAKAAAVLRRLPLKQTSYVLTHLEVPQAAKLWKEFSAPYRERLRMGLDKPFVALLEKAGGYSKDSVGCLMKTDFIAVRTEIKVGALVERLKNLPRKKLPLACWVTGKEGELKGVIRTAELIFYNANSVCGSVMENVSPLHLQDNALKARAQFACQQTTILPVVDEKNIMLGFLEKIQLPPEEKRSIWKRLTR